ncbi:MAG: ABC transporter ATP-binding protein [Patescibacteria group bacterium]
MNIKKERKTKQEYLEDNKNILIALKRMISYTFKIAPIWSALVLISSIASAILPYLATWVNSKIIDELVTIATSGNSDTAKLMYYVGVIVAYMIFTSLLGRIKTYARVNMYFAVSREFGHMVTIKLAHLDTEHYENPDTNDLLQKVRENYTHRPQEFAFIAFNTIEIITSVISGMVIMINFSPIIAVILILATMPILVNDIVYGKRNWGIWGAKGDVRRDYHSTRSSLVNENELKELRVFKTRPYFLNRIYNLYYDFQKEEIKLEKARTVTRIVLDLVNVAGFTFVFLTIVRRVIAKTISIGDFNFYVSTSRSLRSALGEFFGRLSRLYENGLYVVDIFKVLDFENKIEEGTQELANKQTPPLIEFKNVSFTYPGTEKAILKNFSLTIEPGEHIAIVGENGAGKTTLIKLLMRFYDVTEGEILLDGINIKNLKLDNLYSKVGTLFQDFNTYHFDAKTNIGIGNVENLNNIEGVVNAAKQSGAHSFISDYTNGYEQILSKAFKEGITPSTGQWQKIALARAFFKEAPILVLDEPTSAIDPKAEYEIFEKLFDFAKNKSVIIISHRFSTVRNANRILVINDGNILEQGTHEELMQIEDGKYKHAFELQKKGYE